MRAVRLLGVAVAASLLVVAALSGCTSDAPEPAPLPTESPSPSASESPTASPPTLPPEAQGTSGKAAKAFARHYVDLVNYASNTGDVDGLSDAAKADCETCRAIESGISEVYDSGGRLDGDGWRILSTQVLPAPGRQRLVALGLEIAAERRYKLGEADPVVSKATRGNLDVWLTPSRRSWNVVRLVPNQ